MEIFRQPSLLDCSDNQAVRDLSRASVIWLIKIPVVILVGAWAIWCYSTPSDEVMLTIISKLMGILPGTGNTKTKAKH